MYQISKTIEKRRVNMKKAERKWVLLVVCMALIPVGFAISVSAAVWPTRPVQVFVWAAAGGNTDLSNRAIWAGVEELTKMTCNVNQATGAMGGLAAAKVWDARRDGQTVLGLSDSMHAIGLMGAHHTTSKDWDIFVISTGNGIISVRADSPYKTFEDLVEATQKKPGMIPLGHSVIGNIWHVQTLLVENYGGIKFKHVPFEGSSKAVTALMTNEVEAVGCEFGEIYEFIRSGRARPLITMERQPFDIAGVKLRMAEEVLPGIKKAPHVITWLASAIPADTPKEIKDAWAEALQKSFKTEKVQSVLKGRYMKPLGWMPAESRVKLAEMDRTYMWIIYDLGLAKKSPLDFGVQRP
jgi:tripartite-type tricarboxylate transporter receptor subunit TctC